MFWCIRASLTCCRDAENESMILWLGPACRLTPACAAPARSDASMLLPVCGSATDTHSSHRGGPCSSRKLCLSPWKKGASVCVRELYTDTHRYGAIHASFLAGRRRKEDTSSRGAQVLLMAAILHQKREQCFLLHLWSAECRITSLSSSTQQQQQMHDGMFVHMHAYYATLSWQVDDKP